ncbi:CGNR zinc finger domain-containing protein [Microbacterium sp. P05]|uniref:CGNR zinc finger domain-containing protein n=1 Tax=Microbacterium sp. P05 TaxID=3366948 RepID=UPI003745DCF7
MNSPVVPQLYSAIAGHPALDFVNTVGWRLSPSRWEDRVESFDDVVSWVRQFELVDEQMAARLGRLAEAHPALAVRELERVRALREGLYVAAYPRADASHSSGSSRKTAVSGVGAELVAAEYSEAVAAGHLHDESETPGTGWHWQFDADLALPRRRIALMAVDLLTGVTADALGQCADDQCGWVFIDTSPRHNRRWCVAADCGNRNRVRRYNERARRRPAE